jgi:hypothetical protein
MKIEHNFTVPVAERIVKQRASAYLLNSGYRSEKLNENLTYKRGSIFGSLFSYSPLGWKTWVRVSTENGDVGTKVSLTFDIATTGQMVTENERLFLNNEIEGLILAIKSGSLITKPALEAAGMSKAQNVAFAGLIICLAVFLAVLFRSLNETTLAGYLGGIIGTAVGIGVTLLILKIRRVN